MSDTTNDNAKTSAERWLLAATECPIAFSAMADITQSDYLRGLLGRWKSLGCPRPELCLLGKPFDEWSLEFEQLLNVWETQHLPQ